MRFVIHRDGLWFILPALAVTLILLLISLAGAGIWTLVPAMLFLLLTLFFTYFFRDPEREIPEGEELIVSPADGRVILVEEGAASGDQPAERLVSIFMSVFDVHVNRVPVSGNVREVVHKPGTFHKAFQRAAVTENERTELSIETDYGLLRFSQVAGILARRIVCNLRGNERVTRGERFGLIRFGSRADLFLGGNVELRVRRGDRVKAGESIIGAFRKNG
jgi:phosphatidylserine decarboxylase